jgi:(2R)-ethylmalonyl-CoA mutase
MKVDPRAEREQIERLNAFRAQRNATEVKAALANLAETARSGAISCRPRSCALMPASPPANGRKLCATFSANTARPTGIDIPAQ